MYRKKKKKQPLLTLSLALGCNIKPRPPCAAEMSRSFAVTSMASLAALILPYVACSTWKPFPAADCKFASVRRFSSSMSFVVPRSESHAARSTSLAAQKLHSVLASGNLMLNRDSRMRVRWVFFLQFLCTWSFDEIHATQVNHVLKGQWIRATTCTDDDHV